jgi:hypothetical protein
MIIKRDKKLITIELEENEIFEEIQLKKREHFGKKEHIFISIIKQ